MLIVCLAGVGASVAAGGAAALTLVSLTLCMQLLVFLWITCLCPSVDRVDNFAVALGWGAESCSMLLLVLASFLPSLQTGSLQAAACALSLLGVGVPLLKLSYEALLAPLGSCFFRYIDGEARTNPCSMGTLLQLLRLLLTVGHKLAATCCACLAGSSGGATSGMASGHVADSGVVYGGRDDGHPRKKDSSATRPEEAPPEAPCDEKRRSSTDSKDGHEIWPDFLLTESSGGEAPSQTLARAGAAPGAVSGAAPGTAPGSDRAAGVDAARSSDSARGTRRRLTESPRGQPTGLEPPPVRV